MPDSSTAIRVDVAGHHDASILVAAGVLDSSTYRDLRDTVIKTALEEPRAVIVDVNRLSVPSPSAWSVFTSARWHVSVWPDVPVLLVCSDIHNRREIIASGVTRYVPLFRTRKTALAAADESAVTGRRRARTQLPADLVSLRLCRVWVHEWLTTWSQSPLIPVASTVATVFVDNVLRHTDSAPVLIVEKLKDIVTVAVQDCSDQPAVRHEDGRWGTEIVSGLAIVSALSRVWGSTPTSSGKTVWAVIGSENQL